MLMKKMALKVCMLMQSENNMIAKPNLSDIIMQQKLMFRNLHIAYRV